jgi:formiminotetrahydrofolate cyclodeaminase
MLVLLAGLFALALIDAELLVLPKRIVYVVLALQAIALRGRQQVDVRADELRKLFVQAADEDVNAFDTLMDAYRMSRESDAELAARDAAISSATLRATRVPLVLARAAADGIALADAARPLVKDSITSDVLAGRDLLRGAGLAALRTADINLPALEASGQPEAAALRAERGSLLVLLSDAGGAS